MRLTKRQLKRIIREEYSRLKRRGLIKEAGEVDHEQDEFLMEQLADYGDELISAAQDCVVMGMEQMEDDDNPGTPEANACNACTFYGDDGRGPAYVIKQLGRCRSFAMVLATMAQEQQSMFGMRAPINQVIDAIVDSGLADEIIEACQREVSG